VNFKQRVLLVVISTPLFGVFGVTVNHDVFQSAGIILLVSLAIRIQKGIIVESEIGFILVLAGLYLTSTQIGLIIFAVFLIPLFLKKKFWVLALAISMFLLSLVANLGIDNKGKASEFVPATIRNLILIDLKCIVQHPDVSLKNEEWFILERYAPKSSWLQQTSCSNPDVLAAPLFLEKVQVPADRELFKLFFKLVTQEPSIPIMSHIQRSRVALPPPFFQPPTNQVSLDVDLPIGQGTNTALQTGPGILHPSIDDDVYDIRFRVLKPLEALALFPAFLMNQASWFWSWGGLWLWPILFFFVRQMKLRKCNELFPVFAPILTLHFLLFLVGPSSLGRYVMSTIYMGVILAYVQIDSFMREERV
jgi:hypothetical protein